MNIDVGDTVKVTCLDELRLGQSGVVTYRNGDLNLVEFEDGAKLGYSDKELDIVKKES